MPSKCFDFNVYKQIKVNIVIGSWPHYRYIIISSSSICTSGRHGKSDHKRLRQKISFRNKLAQFTNKAFRNDVFVTKNDNFDETGPFSRKIIILHFILTTVSCTFLLLQLPELA